MKIMAVSVPHVSKDFFYTLDRTFPAVTVEPNRSRDDMMYEAGSRRVVDWVRNLVRDAQVTGSFDAVVKPND